VQVQIACDVDRAVFCRLRCSMTDTICT